MNPGRPRLLSMASELVNFAQRTRCRAATSSKVPAAPSAGRGVLAEATAATGRAWLATKFEAGADAFSPLRAPGTTGAGPMASVPAMGPRAESPAVGPATAAFVSAAALAPPVLAAGATPAAALARARADAALAAIGCLLYT